MSSARIFSLVLLQSVFLVSPAFCNEATVRTTVELTRAIKDSKGGDVIRLAPGSYSGLSVFDERFTSPVVITSLDASHPAILTDLMVRRSAGLTFRKLSLVASPLPAGEASGHQAELVIPFSVSGASDIVFDSVDVRGVPNGSLATDVSGLIIRDSDHVTVTNSEFRYLHNALQHLNINYLTVSGNYFHNIRDDSLRGGGSSWVVVENNRCETNHPDVKDEDHPDCIQFWTTNTKSSAHDITIRGNFYRRGKGQPIHGIFVQDEVGAFPYENLTIKDNIILGASWHGIYVKHAHNAVIDGNLVMGFPDQLSWIFPRGGDHMTITNNRSTKFLFDNVKTPVTNLIFKDNHTVGSVTDEGKALLLQWQALHPKTAGAAAGPAS